MKVKFFLFSFLIMSQLLIAGETTIYVEKSFKFPDTYMELKQFLVNLTGDACNRTNTSGGPEVELKDELEKHQREIVDYLMSYLLDDYMMKTQDAVKKGKIFIDPMVFKEKTVKHLVGSEYNLNIELSYRPHVEIQHYHKYFIITRWENDGQFTCGYSYSY